jgi:hypothetical protein
MGGPRSACRGAAYLNKALERTRDKVWRCGQSLGCEPLNACVGAKEYVEMKTGDWTSFLMNDFIAICMFVVGCLALIYSIITGWVTSVRALRAARWLRSHYPEAWQGVPWFFRTVASRETAVRLFLRSQSVSEPEFQRLYEPVRKSETRSWISLCAACAVFAVWLNFIVG